MSASHYYYEVCGIIGGLGPNATSYLFSEIIKFQNAKKDQDNIPFIVFNNPQIPDRTESLLFGKKDPLPELIYTARLLKKIGATFLAIPCNTAHVYIDDIQAIVGLPVIDMISIAASFIAKTYGDHITIGVLATDGAVKSGLYNNAFSVVAPESHILYPDEEGQKQVMEAIYGKTGIKASFITEENYQILCNQGIKLKEKGADIIIAACTEIPVVFANHLLPFIVVDPMEVLAREILWKTLSSKKNKDIELDSKLNFLHNR
jgi:aspartate racemase